MANWWESDPIVSKESGEWWKNDPVVGEEKKKRQDVPDATIGSVAQDIVSGALQIGPTAVKGVADIARMATGDRVGADTSEAMDRGMDAIRNTIGSDRAAAQRANFQADMADDSVGIGDAILNNKGALADMVLPTIGSMFLPVGAATAATKVATMGKAAQALDKTAIAARVAAAQKATGIGTVAAQNAGSTFAEMLEKGESMEDAYIAAGITVPFSVVAGLLTGGGAEGAITRAITGSGAIKTGVTQAAKAAGREGAQEMGEELGQITGEAVGTGEAPSLTSVGKQLAVAGTLGSVMGGGVDVASQMGAFGKQQQEQPAVPPAPTSTDPAAPTKPAPQATQQAAAPIDTTAALNRLTELEIKAQIEELTQQEQAEAAQLIQIVNQEDEDGPTQLDAGSDQGSSDLPGGSDGNAPDLQELDGGTGDNAGASSSGVRAAAPVGDAGVQPNDSVTAAAQPKRNPVPESKDQFGTQASWVIRDKTTGEAVLETFEPKVVEALNTTKYEAVPIMEHLASLNKPKPIIVPESSLAPAQKEKIAEIDGEMQTLEQQKQGRMPHVVESIEREQQALQQKKAAVITQAAAKNNEKGYAVEFNGQRYPVTSIKEAAEKWNEFQEKTGGGVSDIGNGIPVFLDGKQVARISYNGRMWDMQDNEISEEDAAKEVGVKEVNVRTGKRRKLSGNLKNDLDILAPGLFNNVAKGGDGEAGNKWDVGMIAAQLRDEENYMLPYNADSQELANELRDMIRRHAGGETIVSEQRALQEKEQAERSQYRDEIRAKAKKFGIKARKFDDLEAKVLAAVEERHQKAIELLTPRARKVYEKVLAAFRKHYAAYPEAIEEELDALAKQYQEATELEYLRGATAYFKEMLNGAEIETTTGDRGTDSEGAGTGAATGGRADGNQSRQRDARAGQAESGAQAGRQGSEQGQDAAVDPDADIPFSRSKVDVATERSRPKGTITFAKPITGPSGAKLISYSWQWKPFEFVDSRGEDRVGRMSDWDKSEQNIETGRNVVHQFVVQGKDGNNQIVSAESAISLLGYASGPQKVGFRSIESAAKTLARNQMKLAEVEAAKEAFEKDKAEVQALQLPQAMQTDGKPEEWRMGDSWVLQSQRLFPQGKEGQLLPERRKVLEDGWRDNRMKDRGWSGMNQIFGQKIDDLKKRIEKAQKKIDQLTAEQADDFALTGQTEQEIKDQERAQADAAKKKAAEDAAAERKAAADAERDRFTLTGSDRPADAAGQGSLFSRAKKPKFKAVDPTAQEFKVWSNNAPLVKSADANGYEFKTGEKVVVESYHGTGRPDRVGTVFNSKRATSGPMAYFTNAPELASKYAEGKQDTSLSYEDQQYANWFKYKPQGQRSAVDIVRAWYSLDAETKAKISEVAPTLRNSDDGNSVVSEDGNTSGNGSYDYNLQQTQRGYDRLGNPLSALVEDWLNSGVLFNNEELFMQVLQKAGFPVKDVTYDSPHASYPFVYKTYIQMQKPLVTSDIPQEVMDALSAAAKRDRSRAATGGADMWDKNTRTLREWVANLNDPNNKDVSYVWTSIPDKVTDVFRSLGYDGIIDNSGKGGGEKHKVYIPFQETQVKSAIANKGTYDLGKKDILFSRSTAPWYYSQLARAIENLPAKVDNTNAQNVKAWLTANADKLGVKKDEIQWTGITDWLDAQGKRKVSKEEIGEFLKQGGVQVEEVVLQDNPVNARAYSAIEEYAKRLGLYFDGRGPDKYSYLIDENNDNETVAEGFATDIADELGLDYEEDPKGTKHSSGDLVLPGGTDHREIVLTIPTIEPYNESDTTHYGDTGKGKAIAWMRINTRTDANGKKVLFVEEIQSQRNQHGRKKGFLAHDKLSADDLKRIATLSEKNLEKGLSTDEHRELADLRRREKPKSGVPIAPFVSTKDGKATDAYIGLVMKRLVRYAADNGFDSIAWTTGEQQSDRYDLSKQISRITYNAPNGRYADKYGTVLKAFDHNDDVVINKTVAPEELADYVGKDVAERLLESKPDNMGQHSISGLDLKVGGGWTASMYGDATGRDSKGKPSLISQAAGKLGAKVGTSRITLNENVRSRVAPADVGTEEDDNGFWVGGKGKSWDDVPGIEITDAMREQASGGFPLFKRGDNPGIGFNGAANASTDQSDAVRLNNALVRAFNDPTWRNAYVQRDLPDSLNELAAAAEAAFGSKIVAVGPTARRFNELNGIHLAGTNYVNLGSDVSFINITGHEIFHELKRNRPDLYEYLVSVARPYYRNFSQYRDSLNALINPGEKPYDNAGAEEELLADSTGDALADPNFVAELAKADPGKFRKLLTAISSWLKGIANRLKKKGFESSDYFTDVEALRKHLNRVLVAYANGQSVEKIRGMDAPEFSRAATKSQSANMDRGLAAMQKAISGKTTVNRAMYRPDIGWIDFVWGDEGRVKPSGKTVGATGISHIIEARMRKDGLTRKQAEDVATDLVRAIAFGKEIKRDTVGNVVRVGIQHDGKLVWLTGRSGSNAFAVTGYEVEPDARSAGRATATPTQTAASRTRDGMGAGLTAPDATVPSLGQATRGDSTERGGTAGAGSKGSISEDGKFSRSKVGGGDLTREAYDQAKRDGKTELTYTQWQQVRTPEFKRWWGYDWENDNASRQVGNGLPEGQQAAGQGEAGSSMVGRREGSQRQGDSGNQNAEVVGGRSNSDGGNEVRDRARRSIFIHPRTGEPRIFYHGTADNFTEFDVDHPNKKDAGWLGKGHYVTTDREIARSYSMLKAGRSDPRVMELFVRPVNPAIVPPDAKMEIRNYSPVKLAQFNVKARALGHDGVATSFKDGTIELVVFDANSLKSATDNTGAFSESNDLRFSRKVGAGGTGFKAVDTNSPEFKRWFGDSKVVDADGNPLRVYHGTNKNFSQFKGGMYFFSSDTRHAELFATKLTTAGGNVMPVYVSMKNPMIIEDTGVSNALDSLPDDGDLDSLLDALDNVKLDRNIDPIAMAIKAREAGHDGLIIRNDADQGYGTGGDTYIAFSPTQIKSAVSNSGEFSDTNPDIRFSRASNQYQQAKPVELPAETLPRYIQRRVQDKLNRFTVIKEWLAEQGIKLTDGANVFKAEERMHSRYANKAQDFRDKRLNPLIQKVQEAGFTLDDVAQFLHAQHAEERNKQVAKINKNMPDGGSGMTTAEANKILAAAPAELKTVANEFRQITEDTKKTLIKAGIISQDMADAWDGAYKHYVPLKGGPEGDAKQGTGKGLSVNGKQKRALGHTMREEGEWIIENIVADYERALMQAEKNTVGLHLMKMAIEAGMDDLMTVGKPKMRQYLKNKKVFEVHKNGLRVGVYETKEAADLAKIVAGSTGVTVSQTSEPSVALMATPQLQDNEVNVYVRGMEVRIQINDELLARAYRNMGDEALGTILEAGRTLNAYFSKIYTGYNPEFIQVNIVRDFATGLINITGEEGFGMAVKAARNYPQRFLEMLKYARTNNETKWVKMYREDGGNTGAAYLSDMERLGSDIATEYAVFQGVKKNLEDMRNAGTGKEKLKAAWLATRAAGRKVFEKTLVWVERLNQAGENAMRLAVYQAMIESGRSRNEAASLAKNATVNFNRKGELGKQANALYLFFNAGVQGTAAIARAHMKGKYKGQARALSASLVALGYLASLAAAGGDEDDYEEVSEHERSRNILIDTGDGFMKLPLPFGYGFFFNTGRGFADAQRTGEVGKMPWHLASTFVGEFTPFGNTMSGSSPDAKQAFLYSMPTIGQIVGAPLLNQSGMGGPVMPESTFDQHQPDREKMWRQTRGTFADSLAGALEAAGIDVSPETLKHYGRTFTGGAGAFLTSVGDVSTLKLSGSELETSEIPFLRKMYMVPDVRGSRARYNEAKNEVTKYLSDYKRAIKAEDFDKADQIAVDHIEMLQAARMAEAFSKMATAQRDMIDNIRLKGRYSKAEERALIKELEEEERQIYRDYMENLKGLKHEKRERVAAE